MSLDKKIKDIVEEKTVPVSSSGPKDFPLQGSSKKKVEQGVHNEPDLNHGDELKRDTTVPRSSQGTTDFPEQGDSKKDPKQIESSEDAGEKAADNIKKDTTIPRETQGTDDFPKQGDSKVAKWEVKSFTKEEIEKDIKTIFGEEVEDSIKDKAVEVFEAAVIARINLAMDSAISKLEEQYNNTLEEELANIQENLDKYLDYISKKYIEENQIAIDIGLKEEISVSFIKGLKDLFESHYIEVPEGKEDIIENLTVENQKLKLQLNNTIHENIDFKKSLSEANKQDIVESFSTGMTLLDQEKFSKLIEGIEFTTEDSYRNKLNVIKESHFTDVVDKPGDLNLDSGTGITAKDDEISKIANAIKSMKL